jgi:serine/threonine protein kinase
VFATLVANPTSEHGFAVVRPPDAVARPLTPLQLEELLGRGAHGSTWRARLPDGTRVAVKRLASVGENRAAFLERLERVAEVHHANLLDVFRAVDENGELWVISRLGDGVPLSTLLKSGRMRSGSAVAVGMGILSGLTALHQAGLWHGSVHARNVHVDLDGIVRLGDHGLTPAPSGQSAATLRAADVRGAGALICAMLKVPLENGPVAGQRQALKVASSPLGLAAKAIAGPPRKLPAGYEAAHASLTLWEAARKMATSRRQAQARQDLSAMVTEALGSARPTVVRPPRVPQASRSRRPTPSEDGLAQSAAAGPTPAADPAARSSLAEAVAPSVEPPGPSVLEQLPSPPPPLAEPSRWVLSPPAPVAVPEAVPAVAPAAAPAPAPVRPQPQRTARRRTLLALVAAVGLLALCLLMVVVSASPARKQAPAPARPAPTAQIVGEPRPTTDPAPVVAPPPTFGDVPVTTPVTVVPGTQATTQSAPSRPPAAPPGAPALSIANLPPATAAGISSVTVDISGCAAGSACTISVEVTLQPMPSRRNVSWTLNSIDLCTGTPVLLASVSVTAQPGWSHVIGLSTVTMPRSVAQLVVAVTDSPARASSPLASLGVTHCP